MGVTAQCDLQDVQQGALPAATTPAQSQASKDVEDCEMKKDYLSRRLARVKTACPGCQKTLQVGTLAWTHKCKSSKEQPSEHAVRERSAKMLANATRNHEERMAKHTNQRSRSRSRSRSVETCLSNPPGVLGADTSSYMAPN